jgi:ubiquinone/menaquinone biosynthesis C-methylase UbiE
VLQFVEARLCDAADAFDNLRGIRDPLRPPRRMIFVGSNSLVRSDYHAIGRELAGLAVRLGGLRPDDAVLEVGSGTGRMAVALTAVLSQEGRFEGFDIVREGVEWCQAHLTPRFPRFRFHHADLFNSFYCPAGGATAAAYRFPFDDGTFDFVLSTSVLTHMYRAEAAHYLSEVARVLRPGGRTFITHFLLTPESRLSVQDEKSSLRFAHPVPDGLTTDPAQPEAAIAIDVEAVTADYAAAGLVIADPIYPGTWSGRPAGESFQDIVVSVRR